MTCAELDCDMVGVDNERGSYEATSHLNPRGARRLLVLEEDLPITTIRVGGPASAARCRTPA